MRGRILAVGIVVLGLLAPAPPPAAATCEGGECGVPECSSMPLRVRPGLARPLYVTCERAIGVKVLSGPAHGTISDLSLQWSTVRFTIHAREDAPRHDEFVLEVAGEYETIEHRFPIEVKPLAENAPPVCYGAEASKRSSGKEPVDVNLYPWCADPDGDEFTAAGGGPGVHLDAPVHTPSLHTLSSWRYRTATHSGTETTRLWATDILGARSDEVELKTTVGPDIDRLAVCGVINPAAQWDNVFEVRSRPGRTRRFGIQCGDPDGDPFAVAPSQAPSRGVFAPVLIWASQESHWSGQTFDATYVPSEETMEPDEFAVTATGAAGSQQARIRIVPRALPGNGGGWCGWSGAWTVQNAPADLNAECTDEEGDDLSVEILEGPRDGTAGVPVAAVGLFGTTRITVPYVPNPGYTGYDCVKVRVTDGHGFEQTFLLEVTVQKLVEPLPPVPEPPLPLPPVPPVDLPLPPVELPRRAGAPAHPPGQVAAMVQAYAEQALGVPEVRRLPATGPAFVWAPPKLSRAELVRDGMEPAMVVICPRGCRLRSETELFSGSRARARASRCKTAQVLPAGQAHVLWATADRGQRAALRRAKAARVTFRLELRPHGAKARSVKRAIPLVR